jgi:hypothetical protein
MPRKLEIHFADSRTVREFVVRFALQNVDVWWRRARCTLSVEDAWAVLGRRAGPEWALAERRPGQLRYYLRHTY